jgi:hypothetical protein
MATWSQERPPGFAQVFPIASFGVQAFVVIVIVLTFVVGLCGYSYGEGRTASVGTPKHPQVLTCAEEATQFTGTLPRAGPHDVVFGPGYFPQARRLATMSPQTWAPGSRGTYKLPPVIKPGATVTLTIARDARSYVVQQNPWSPPNGSQSVTYRACAHSPGFFPQSFRFTDGRLRGCVPIDVRVNGQRATRRVVLSLFAGRCSNSSNPGTR